MVYDGNAEGAPLMAAVIFDVDGTLVDTVDFHAEAWQRVFADFGHDIPFADLRAQIGKGSDMFLPVFLDKDEIERSGEAMSEARKKLFLSEYMPRVQGFATVPELFARIAEAGMKTALASSATAEELEGYKKAADIEGIPDVETSSDDAENSKPEPDIFQAAADKLGLKADEVVVIGDTPYDAEAAKKADMAFVGVLSGGFPEAQLREAGAIDIYQDPADLLARFDTSPLAALAERSAKA
jgi:phosphoglycolate phosphatase-like HAD superfamily hydrolase